MRVKRAAHTQTLWLLVGVTVISVAAATWLGDVLSPSQPPEVRAVEIGKSRRDAEPQRNSAPERREASEPRPGDKPAPRSPAPATPPASTPQPPVADDEGGADDDGD
jgi:hypothetical protein